MFSRRSLVTGAAAAGSFLLAPALRAQRWLTAYPFSLGISAGDPSPDGFVIWTRLATDPMAPHGGMPMSALPVGWEVSTGEDFAQIVAKGETLARPEIGHSIHVEVSGLQPGRAYWYRFACAGARSVRGLARTLPAPGSSPASLRFGVAGCQNYEDGLFTAYRHLAREDLDFVFHYGDFIYEAESAVGKPGFSGLAGNKVRRHAGGDLYDLADYRRRYAQYLMDMDLQAARSAHSWFPTYDDHEVVNDWTADSDAFSTPAELFRIRRAAAFQAWYEHMPVRRARMPQGPAIALYREARFGDLLQIDFCDTRQYRSLQPCGGGFRARCPEASSAERQMLGREQEAWLARNLSRGGARWNCIAQQVMMMSLDRPQADGRTVANLDSWAGYEAPRRRLLSRMAGLDNVVVLTGDEHQNFAGILHDRHRPVAVEFVSTSISSGGDGSDLRTGSDRMLAANPQLKFVNDQRGYLRCEVGRDEWRTDFMVLDRVTLPGSAIGRRASASVAHGAPALAIA